MREIVAYLFGEIDRLNDSGIVYASIAQKAHLRLRHIRPT